MIEATRAGPDRLAHREVDAGTRLGENLEPPRSRVTGGLARQTQGLDPVCNPSHHACKHA